MNSNRTRIPIMYLVLIIIIVLVVFFNFQNQSSSQDVVAINEVADQKHTFGDSSAQRDEFLRLLQELDHLVELLFGFLDPGHVLKSDRGMIA